MDEGQGRGIPAAHAGVRLPDRPQTPSRRQRVEGCSQSQGKVRSQNAGESRSSLIIAPPWYSMDPLYRQAIIQGLFGILLFVVLIFWPAGTLDYWQGLAIP